MLMGKIVSCLYQQVLAIVCTGGLLSTLPPMVYAADNQPNCDVRQLDLTPIQKAKLRFIRMQYKNTLDNAAFNNARQNYAGVNGRGGMNQLVQILMQPDFDDGQAKHYVFEKYKPRMQREVAELQVQHAFLQVLNVKQRQDWLRNCLR